MQTQTVARAGVLVALLAVAAYVTVPFGPVPFTLQTLVLAMLPAAVDRETACLAVVAYVLLGALGMPVFSGFMGGVGVLLGPTGGFLWGFVAGTALATTLMRLLPARIPLVARTVAADIVLLLVSYSCGTAQLMAVGAMGAVPALLAAVVPFVVPDAIKIAVGARLGCDVARATRRSVAAGDRF